MTAVTRAAEAVAAELPPELPPLCSCDMRHPVEVNNDSSEYGDIEDAYAVPAERDEQEDDDDEDDEDDDDDDDDGLPPLCACGMHHFHEEEEEEDLPPLCRCGRRHGPEEMRAAIPERCACGVRHGYDDVDDDAFGGGHRRGVGRGGGGGGRGGYGFRPWNSLFEGLSTEEAMEAVRDSLGGAALAEAAATGDVAGLPPYVMPLGPVMLDGNGMAAFFRHGADGPPSPPPRAGLSAAAIERLAPAVAWPPPSAMAPATATVPATSRGGGGAADATNATDATDTTGGAASPAATAAATNYAEEDCVVCQDSLRGPARVRVLPCGHVFHAPCADRWLTGNATCPSCRYDLADGAATA